jgi:outer membrane protein assembly factor BamB
MGYNISRRQLLSVCGATAGSVVAISPLAADHPPTTNQIPRKREWPMEQHDAAGTSYSQTASGPKESPRIRWKRQLNTRLGFAYKSTPIVADGRVYAVDQELLCVDAMDGTEIFRSDRSYPTSPAITTARAYRSPTLAFATQSGAKGLHPTGGRSFAGIHFGQTRWQASLDNTVYFFGGGQQRIPPVAADGTVLVTALNDLLAIDASSGDIRWHGTGGEARPAVRDNTVYVPSFSEGVLGYNLETGSAMPSIDTRSFRPLSVAAAPDCLVIGTDRGVAGANYDGTTRWQYEPSGLTRDYGAVAVAEDVAYAGFRGDNQNWLVAIDIADGSERWRSKMAPEQEPQFAPPTVADGVVYVPTEDDGLAAIDAATGDTRWRFTEGDQRLPWSPAAVVGETLYAVGNGHLYALEEA